MMNWKKNVLLGMIVTGGIGLSALEEKTGPQAQEKSSKTRSETKVLESGYYTARVGAIVCGGCRELIENTMREVPGIGASQVDEKTSQVRFAVLTGKRVRLNDLQKALRVSAESMGMGADYVLSDVKPMKKA